MNNTPKDRKRPLATWAITIVKKLKQHAFWTEHMLCYYFVSTMTVHHRNIWFCCSYCQSLSIKRDYMVVWAFWILTWHWNWPNDLTVDSIGLIKLKLIYLKQFFCTEKFQLFTLHYIEKFHLFALHYIVWHCRSENSFRLLVHFCPNVSLDDAARLSWSDVDDCTLRHI